MQHRCLSSLFLGGALLALLGGVANLPAQTIVTNIVVPPNARAVDLNAGLNRLYLVGDSDTGPQCFAINGDDFTSVIVGPGNSLSLDGRNNNIWTADELAGFATVRAGANNVTLTNLALGALSFGVSVDATNRRAWQLGHGANGKDSISILDTDNFSRLAGPVQLSGRIGSQPMVNPKTGRFYFTETGISKRITLTDQGGAWARVLGRCGG